MLVRAISEAPKRAVADSNLDQHTDKVSQGVSWETTVGMDERARRELEDGGDVEQFKYRRRLPGLSCKTADETN